MVTEGLSRPHGRGGQREGQTGEQPGDREQPGDAPISLGLHHRQDLRQGQRHSPAVTAHFLATAHAAMGNTAEALLAYEAYRRVAN